MLYLHRVQPAREYYDAETIQELEDNGYGEQLDTCFCVTDGEFEVVEVSENTKMEVTRSACLMEATGRDFRVNTSEPKAVFNHEGQPYMLTHDEEGAELYEWN